MKDQIKIEVCASSLESVATALKCKVDRVELCQALDLGGLTPDIGMVEIALRLANVYDLSEWPDALFQVFALVRPRPGNFVYTDLEFEQMLANITAFKRINVAGIVSGILLEDNTIDLERTKTLVEASKPLSYTFHRAFDEVSDPFQACEQLINLGIDRILTSGQQPSAQAGISLLQKLQQRYGDQIIIMAGAGINAQNIKEIQGKTGVQELHLSAKSVVGSPDESNQGLGVNWGADEAKLEAVMKDFGR